MAYSIYASSQTKVVYFRHSSTYATLYCTHGQKFGNCTRQHICSLQNNCNRAWYLFLFLSVMMSYNTGLSPFTSSIKAWKNTQIPQIGNPPSPLSTHIPFSLAPFSLGGTSALTGAIELLGLCVMMSYTAPVLTVPFLAENVVTESFSWSKCAHNCAFECDGHANNVI